MSLIDSFLLEAAPLNIWVAWRSDGVKGSGTHSDPYDASTNVAVTDDVTDKKLLFGSVPAITRRDAVNHRFEL